MKRNLVWLGLLVLLASPAVAQGPATVTGRVTGPDGATPEAAVLVRIESMNAGAATGADGTYRLVIPAARIRPGVSVTITASRAGLSPVSRTLVLHADSVLTADFRMTAATLLLDDLVVTGAVTRSRRASGEGRGSGRWLRVRVRNGDDVLRDHPVEVEQGGRCAAPCWRSACSWGGARNPPRACPYVVADAPPHE